MLSLPTNLDWPISFHHGFNNVTTAIKIFAGEWASGSLVMGCISNWKGNLHREMFLRSPFRQHYSQRKHSQSAMHWFRKAMVIWWFCILLWHLFCWHKKGRRSWEAEGSWSAAFSINSSFCQHGLLMEPQPKQISKHMSSQGRNESRSAKGTVIPWEREILSDLMLSTLQDCPSPHSEMTMGPLQL